MFVLRRCNLLRNHCKRLPLLSLTTVPLLSLTTVPLLSLALFSWCCHWRCPCCDVIIVATWLVFVSSSSSPPPPSSSCCWCWGMVWNCAAGSTFSFLSTLQPLLARATTPLALLRLEFLLDTNVVVNKISKFPLLRVWLPHRGRRQNM